METNIIGAGFAGLITACKIKDVPIIESGERIESHKALLRFRDESVSIATDIAFRPVTVRKEINCDRKSYRECNIALANRYSRKVVRRYINDRSIWNLDTVTRFVAPPDFYDQLCDRHAARINWNTSVSEIKRSNGEQWISTMPLPAMIKACGLPHVHLDFSHSRIRVNRFRLPPETDIYQTVYFPEEALKTFRASVTGDLLIVEQMAPENELDWTVDEEEELERVLAAFGFTPLDIEPVESVHQRYGKIVELPRQDREALLYELTRDFNVFSIGRFATWRNILLDDVVKDIEAVQRLIAASIYGRELILAERK